MNQDFIFEHQRESLPIFGWDFLTLSKSEMKNVFRNKNIIIKVRDEKRFSEIKMFSSKSELKNVFQNQKYFR